MSKTLPVAVQVYGLRDLLENSPENFKDVMQKVKDIGYDGVEFAGLYDLEPSYIKQVLDEVGLKAVSAHVPFDLLLNDLNKVIEDYKTIGVEYIVMPYVTEEYRPSNPEGFADFLPKLNEIGKKVNEAGLTFLYHNHDFEFTKLPNGKWGYDEMFDTIPKENLQSELDTCWCDVATGQPVEFIEKYAGRLPVVHLKDYIKKGDVTNMYALIGVDSDKDSEETGYFGFRPVGFGMMIWEPILDAATKAGAQWVVVEQDQHYDLDPLEAARRSREYLKILGW